MVFLLQYSVEACPETLGPFPPPLEESLPLDTYEEFVVQHNAKVAFFQLNPVTRFFANFFPVSMMLLIFIIIFLSSNVDYLAFCLY